MRTGTAWAAALALACCAATGWARNVERPAGTALGEEALDRWPTATAPRLPRAPVIDGEVDRREWAPAAQLAPLIDCAEGLALRERTAVYVGYTDEKLYVAFRFDRPRYSPPPRVSPAQSREEIARQDDCVEIVLQADGPRGAVHLLTANAATAFGTTLDPPRAFKCEYKARAVDGGWEGEFAVPFAELGLKAPAVGTVWGFNVIQRRKTPTELSAAWSFTSDPDAREDMGFLRFDAAAPAVRFDRMGEMGDESIGGLVEVGNFAEGACTVRAACSLFRATDGDRSYYRSFEGEADVFGAATDAMAKGKVADIARKTLGYFQPAGEKTASADVAAQGRAALPLTVKGAASVYVMRYRVFAADNRLLAGGAFAFAKRVPLELTYIPYFLTARSVAATADLSRVKNLPAGSVAVFRIMDAAGRTVSETRAAVAAGKDSVEVDLATDKLPEGRCTVRAEVADATGKPVAVNTLTFEKPAAPEWFGSKLGYPETPPEPWTPVTAEGRRVGVWGRTITLDGGLLPASVVSAGQELLSAPARLELDGRAADWIAGGAQPARRDSLQAVYTAEGRTGGLQARLDTRVEFDGFMRYDLTLTPQGAVEAKSLVLDIPFRAEQATHFARHNLLGVTPASRYDANAIPDEGIRIPFTFAVWIGNDERGMQWFCETDRDWSLDDPAQAIEIVKDRDSVRLRVRFISRAARIDKPLSFTWALLPTPTKPLSRKLMRDTLICQGGFPEYKPDYFDRWKEQIDAHLRIGANAIICWSWEQQIWNPLFGNPCLYDADRIEAMKRCVDYAHAKGIKILLYAIWGTMFPSRPEWKHFGLEMARYPKTYTCGNTLLYCPRSTFNDWYIWSLAKTIRETGVDGVYLDSSPMPDLCVNLHHGCGYVDASGKTRGSFPVFANRELHKRIYTLVHGQLARDGIVYAHNTAPPVMASESFVDIHHSAEGSSLPQAQWRSRFYGRPYGLPVTFTYWNLPHYPMKRVNAWGAALLLDAELKAVVSMWPPYTSWIPKDNYTDSAYIIGHIWALKRSFAWDGAEWWPYWKNGDYVRTEAETTMVSFHLQRGKEVFLIVTNWSDRETQAQVRLNLAAMGLDPKRVVIRDIVLGWDEALQNDGATLRINILSKRPRLFHIFALPQGVAQ